MKQGDDLDAWKRFFKVIFRAYTQPVPVLPNTDKYAFYTIN